jgi:hypothetical protein
VVNDLKPLTMAYMDVPPSSEANGSTVVLTAGSASGMPCTEAVDLLLQNAEKGLDV